MNDLRLALITDIHLGPDTGYVKGPVALENLEQTLMAAYPFQIDSLIDLGDRVTEEGDAKDETKLTALAQIFKRYTNRHHIRGNHDLLDLEVQERILEGPLRSRAIELKGWQLIFLDTFDYGSIGGQIRSSEISWLGARLAQHQLPTILFTHQPLHDEPMFGNPYFESLHAADTCPRGANLVRQLLARFPHVHLCVSGHAHWNDLRMVQDIPYLTIQSLSESIFTQGLPACAWTLLELPREATGRIYVRVFGIDPFETHIPIHPRQTKGHSVATFIEHEEKEIKKAEKA